ncbi:hypothetical protein GobsT_71200 [Gemmata obscuriglobus]|nr:hypothetical protein [Gemmata obscuriglobus]QEG32267.1 hypothetical protein GobsT_71200 [Gemmata obscuriglobus]VTS11623.1 unnamed protein product [Gemmata obscuriglobus UQM 2246]
MFDRPLYPRDLVAGAYLAGAAGIALVGAALFFRWPLALRMFDVFTH